MDGAYNKYERGAPWYERSRDSGNIQDKEPWKEVDAIDQAANLAYSFRYFVR